MQQNHFTIISAIQRLSCHFPLDSHSNSLAPQVSSLRYEILLLARVTEFFVTEDMPPWHIDVLIVIVLLAVLLLLFALGCDSLKRSLISVMLDVAMQLLHLLSNRNYIRSI